MAYFRLLASDLPTVRLFLEHRGQAKYKFPDGPINYDTLEAFLDDFQAGKLKVSDRRYNGVALTHILAHFEVGRCSGQLEPHCRQAASRQYL